MTALAITATNAIASPALPTENASVVRPTEELGVMSRISQRGSATSSHMDSHHAAGVTFLCMVS